MRLLVRFKTLFLLITKRKMENNFFSEIMEIFCQEGEDIKININIINKIRIYFSIWNYYNSILTKYGL